MARRTALVIAVLAALSASALTAQAAPDDGKSRRVRIFNDTGKPMVRFFAEPADERFHEPPEDILGGAIVQPGESLLVNLDDGDGTCVFKLEARFEGRADLVVKSDACTTPELHLVD